jgi:hypothetical protein
MLPALLEESASISRFRQIRGRFCTGSIAALLMVGVVACGGGERQDAGEPEGEFPVEVTGAKFAPEQTLAQASDLILEVTNTGDEAVPDLAVTLFTVADTADEIDAAAADELSEPTATGADGEKLPEEELGAAVEQALQEELEQAGSEAGDPAASEAGAAAADDQSLPQANGPFSVLSPQPGLEVPARPVWILEQGYPVTNDNPPSSGAPGDLAGASNAGAAQTNTFAFGPLEPDETVKLVWKLTPVQAGLYTVRYRLAAGLQGKAVAVGPDDSVPEGEFTAAITNAAPQTRVTAKGKVVPITKNDVIGQVGAAAGEADGAKQSP